MLSLIQALPEERLLLALIGLALAMIPFVKTMRNKQYMKCIESRHSFWQINTHHPLKCQYVQENKIRILRYIEENFS